MYLSLNLLERSDFIYIYLQVIYIHIQLRYLELNHFFPTIICSHFLKSFAVVSRTWKFKRAKNARYKDENFLKVFFFSEIIGRSIHNTSEMLNEYLLKNKKGRRKLFSDGRRKRVIPHQTEVNKYLHRIGFNKARNILRTCLDFQLTEALKLKLISRKVNILIDFT